MASLLRGNHGLQSINLVGNDIGEISRQILSHGLEAHLHGLMESFSGSVNFTPDGNKISLLLFQLSLKLEQLVILRSKSSTSFREPCAIMLLMSLEFCHADFKLCKPSI